MKISDEAVEAACKIVSGPGFGTHRTLSDRAWYDRQRKLMREAIQTAMTVDGYTKLLAKAMAVMRETGWPNAIDHVSPLSDSVIELAAYETYAALKTKMGD